MTSFWTILGVGPAAVVKKPSPRREGGGRVEDEMKASER
jgi:hypothetical protein